MLILVPPVINDLSSPGGLQTRSKRRNNQGREIASGRRKNCGRSALSARGKRKRRHPINSHAPRPRARPAYLLAVGALFICGSIIKRDGRSVLGALSCANFHFRGRGKCRSLDCAPSPVSLARFVDARALPGLLLLGGNGGKKKKENLSGTRVTL